MDTFDDHLTFMESTTGPGFAAAIEPGGVLREWIVQHLADETGEDVATAQTGVDQWLDQRDAATASEDGQEIFKLDDQIEMLVERRRQLDDIEDDIEIAYLESETGAAMADIGRPLDALARFMTARDAFMSLDFAADVGVCDMELAMIAKNLGWHQAARRLYERARPLIAENGTVGDFAKVLSNQANLEQAVGASDEAIELRQKARWLAYEAGESGTFAVATHNLGNSAADRGDFETAIELFLDARNIYVDLDDQVSVADCDKNAGAAMIDNGHYDDGVGLARQALDVYMDYGEPVGAAHARRTIAHALDHLGRHDEALAELKAARTTYKESGLVPDIAKCDVDRSYTLRSLGRFDEAATAVNLVREAYRETGLDADDPWFDETLAAIERHEVDRHEHPIIDPPKPTAAPS